MFYLNASAFESSMNFLCLLLQQELLKDRNGDEVLINRPEKLDAAQNVSVTVTGPKKLRLPLTNSTGHDFSPQVQVRSVLAGSRASVPGEGGASN